jgi:hypothetical protein
MESLERARIIKKGMERGTGMTYSIHFDKKHKCFRVIPKGDRRNHLELIQE